jgi:hypothetical protein
MGRVVNAADLKPIVDATVEVQGDITTVTLTDSAGRYSIAIPRPDATLVVSSLGYTQQEISPEGRAIVNVTLVPGPLLLEELAVTGYGQRVRATVSGSVDRSEGLQASGTLPCDGAALTSPPALDPQAPPLVMPPPEPPSAPIPNACAAPPERNP